MRGALIIKYFENGLRPKYQYQYGPLVDPDTTLGKKPLFMKLTDAIVLFSMIVIVHS